MLEQLRVVRHTIPDFRTAVIAKALFILSNPRLEGTPIDVGGMKEHGDSGGKGVCLYLYNLRRAEKLLEPRS